MKRLLQRIAVALAACAAIAGAQAQDGVTPTTILIGQSAAFTGPAAQLGIQMRDGAKLYLNYVNSLGGVNGRKIEMKSLDDKYESKLAAENTKKTDRAGPGVPALRVRRHADEPGGAADLHRGARAVRRAVHRRRAAARAVQPLHLQRPRKLLRRNGTHRRPSHPDRRQEDRGLLPERRLRSGRPGGHEARDGQAQPSDHRARHRRAQHDGGRRSGEDDQRRAARGDRDDLGVHVGRRIREADEEDRAASRSSSMCPSSAARHSPRRSATRATAC